jgi:hypothetical protein
MAQNWLDLGGSHDSGTSVEFGGDHWDAPHRIAEASGDSQSGFDEPLVLDKKVSFFWVSYKKGPLVLEQI